MCKYNVIICCVFHSILAHIRSNDICGSDYQHFVRSCVDREVAL